MTETQQEVRVETEPRTVGSCVCESFARVTERAALAGARWLGRADTEAAQEAAFSGATSALATLPISGRIVIAPEEEQHLVAGSQIGAGVPYREAGQLFGRASQSPAQRQLDRDIRLPWIQPQLT